MSLVEDTQDVGSSDRQGPGRRQRLLFEQELEKRRHLRETVQNQAAEGDQSFGQVLVVRQPGRPDPTDAAETQRGAPFHSTTAAHWSPGPARKALGNFLSPVRLAAAVSACRVLGPGAGSPTRSTGMERGRGRRGRLGVAGHSGSRK